MNEQTGSKLSFSSDALAEGLKIAREASGKSTTECGQLLGISSSRIRSYESGKYIPSLPELESLAYIYNIPLPALLDPQSLPKFIHQPNTRQFKQLLDIRSRIIATRLQLARENQGITHKELSKQTSISVPRIKRYEKCELPIPLNELTALSEALGVDFADLLDSESPIGSWQTAQIKMQSFSELPDETKAFALNPANQPYIALAKQLQEIGQEKFKQMSESIQNILSTFNPKE
jgi:transcriptional regulator with XRE-family HTH domain